MRHRSLICLELPRIRFPRGSSLLLLAASFCVGAEPPFGAGTAGPQFNKDIKPILAEHCFKCHGSDEKARMGIKPGMTYGETDEIGYHIARNPVHVHDFHATMLHLLGINHERFTYRFQGRDFRLTDVSGRVVDEILVTNRKVAT